MKTTLTRTLFALGALFPMATAEAQVGEVILIDTMYERIYGPSVAGGALRAEAKAGGTTNVETGYSEAHASAKLSKDLRMFGFEIEAAAIEARGHRSTTSGGFVTETGYHVRVLDGIVTFVEHAEDIDWTLPPLNILPGNGLSIPVPIGPVTVTLRANAGLRSALAYDMSYGATANIPEGTLDAHMTVQLGGNGKVWAFGNASATLSAVVIKVGVEADMRFGNLLAGPVLEARPQQVAGALVVNLVPIEIEVAPFIKVYIPFLGWKKTKKTLVNWGASAYAANFPLN